MKFMPDLSRLHEEEEVRKNIPKFINQRRALESQYCPEVIMEFGFRKKADGSIVQVQSNEAPLKDLQRNPEYSKLYEIASVKVIN